HRSRERDPRGRGRRALCPSRARRAPHRGGRRSGAARRSRSVVGARARGAAASRTRPHESGDREDALHLRSHDRDAPGAHHAEARPPIESRARAVRACQRAHRSAVRRGGRLRRPPRCPAVESGGYATGTAVFGVVAGLWRNVSAVCGFRSAPPIARIPNPIPERRSAMPTTMPNNAIWLARKDVLSAVVRAVSVTHTLRAPFDTGRFVVGSIAANCALLVPPPGMSCAFGASGLATYMPICE